MLVCPKISPPILKEKAVVYQKVRTTPNQVYKVTGVTEHQTVELTALVNEDNADGCDEFFWSAPIDNADETVGLSERTSWKVKGRYVAEPLNKPTNFDVPSTSGTKEVPVEYLYSTSEISSMESEPVVQKPKQKANIHRQPKQVNNQKQQRNLRYKKNLSERKQFWRSQNPHYTHLDRNSKPKGEENKCKRSFGPLDQKNQKKTFGP